MDSGSENSAEFSDDVRGEFETTQDENKYLKSIVSELQSKNREQTVTLENITEEVNKIMKRF